MSDRHEDKVRQRAHEIWETEGRPEGRDQEHWERAVREIKGRGAVSGDLADVANNEAAQGKTSDAGRRATGAGASASPSDRNKPRRKRGQ